MGHYTISTIGVSAHERIWPQSIHSQAFQAVPVVLTAVSSVNEAEAVITQVRNISTTGFELRMQEQERHAQVYAAETVDDIAREPSAGTLDGWTFEVNATQDVM